MIKEFIKHVIKTKRVLDTFEEVMSKHKPVLTIKDPLWFSALKMMRDIINCVDEVRQERALKQVEITQCIIGYAKADDNGDTIVSVDDIN